MARSNVRYLGRERDPREARRLFNAARSAEALAALGANASVEAGLLRVRCHLRLRDPHAALEALGRVKISDAPDHIKAEHHLLRGTAYHRAGDEARARRCFATTAVYAERLGGTAAAEYWAILALAAWSDRDLVHAEALAHKTLATPDRKDESYTLPLSLVRTHALELLSLIAAVREDYGAQTAFLMDAWLEQSMLPDHQRDEFVRASLLKNLAPLISELQLPDEAEFLTIAAATMHWTAETALARWAVHRALAWRNALEGNYLLAFPKFLDCVAIAPTTPLRIASMLDRAYLAAEIRNTVIQHEEMARMTALANTVPWDTVHGEEANVLLLIAEAVAREDGLAARRWLLRFDRTRAFPKRLLLVANDDRRQTAWERDAEAEVLAAEGRLGEAIGLRRLTFETWSDLRHGWRAARSAVAIADLTKAPQDVARAQHCTDDYRKSWLGRKAQRLARAVRWA